MSSGKYRARLGREGRFLVCNLASFPKPHPTCDPSRCPSREDFPLIETEDEAYLRRIKSKSRGVWGRTDACICMAESLSALSETITALLIG